MDKSLQEDLSRALALEELLQKAVRQADTREQGELTSFLAEGLVRARESFEGCKRNCALPAVGAGLPPRAPTDGDTLDSLLGHALQFADPALRAEIERLVR